MNPLTNLDIGAYREAAYMSGSGRGETHSHPVTGSSETVSVS